jgi:methionyl-tRNA formyltransferase
MKRRVIIATKDLSDTVVSIVENINIHVVGILNCNIHHAGNELLLFAEYRKIPCLLLEKQGNSEAQWIKDKNPDIMVVFQVPFLLKEHIFSIPKYGSINMHPSLLPKYRGINPWFWIYYNMEQETGVTIHFIDKGEDTGNIIASRKTTISIGETLNDLRQRVMKTGTELLLESIIDIENVKQIIHPIQSPTQRAVFVDNAWDIIDWKNWSVERIWHLVRGFPEIIPLHGIVGVNHFESGTPNYEPGKIIAVNNHEYFIPCKNGIIFVG